MSSGIKIFVSHGHDRHEIFLPVEDSTLEDLRKSVEQATGVPPLNQKLIFKGSSLAFTDEKLSKLGIFNNSKMMVIGQKFSVKDEGHLGTMSNVEKEFKLLESKYKETLEQFQHLQNGFVDEHLHVELKSQLKKKANNTSQRLMKSLETLDSLILSDSSTLIQAKRKNLVDQINTFLNKVDALQESIYNFSS